jgi:hypothetical protein
LITVIKSNGKLLSLSNGPRFTGFTAPFISMKNYISGDNYIIEELFGNGCHASWTMMPGGWIKIDYDYTLTGTFDYAGITFSYPENLVKGAKLMANGPYHSWKNRLKGTEFGIYDKKYNNTITGESWVYPEFKGYYSNFYAIELETSEMPFTVISATKDLFLHLFTPGEAKYSRQGVRGEVNPPFPDGNMSFLHAISPIGTKFTKADAEGPQSQKNVFNGETLRGTLYFRFGE